MADVTGVYLKKNNKKPFKILCIDGGGIKGLYSAQILAKFENIFNCKISDHFDLICGTSTGGIIALGISLGIPMSDICNFYETHGPTIFCAKTQKLRLGKYLHYFKQICYRGKYSNKYLKKALISVFGNRTLQESQNLLCIPAYNITMARPRVFKKDYGSYTEDGTKQYVDVALATAAAPTYFPVKEINNHQYIDGGVWANNPTLVGLTEFIINFADKHSYQGVDILSISSIIKPSNELHKKTERSFVDWKDTLFDTFSTGQSRTTDFFIQKVQKSFKFPIRYKRIEHDSLSETQLSVIDMDKADEKAIKALKAIGTDTGIKFKDDDFVKQMFETLKTYNNDGK